MTFITTGPRQLVQNLMKEKQFEGTALYVASINSDREVVSLKDLFTWWQEPMENEPSIVLIGFDPNGLLLFGKTQTGNIFKLVKDAAEQANINVLDELYIDENLLLTSFMCDEYCDCSLREGYQLERVK